MLTGSDDVDATGVPAFTLSEQKQDCIVGQCAEVLSVFYLRSVRFKYETHRFACDDSKLLFAYVTTQILQIMATELLFSETGPFPQSVIYTQHSHKLLFHY
jgi:hypothetical protein